MTDSSLISTINDVIVSLLGLRERLKRREEDEVLRSAMTASKIPEAWLMRAIEQLKEEQASKSKPAPKTEEAE